MSITSQYRSPLAEYVTAQVERAGLPPEGRAGKSVTSGAAYYIARRNGRLEAGVEYYRPESFSDDDLSTAGWVIPPRMGYTRTRSEVSADSIDELVSAIRGE